MANRIFFYSGNVDDAYKAAAKKSLTEAGWIPQQEFDDVQSMTCTGPERSTCTAGASDPWVVLAVRS